MKDLKAVRGKFYLQRVIAEGEHEQQDFKFTISDAHKIAHSISAFANNRGGRLLIGVKDNGVIAGVRSEEDIYVVEQAAEMYCRPAQHPVFSAYSAEDGAVVIKVEIAASPERPVQAREVDGAWRAYYRVADENIVASPLMVKAWRRKSDPQAGATVFDADCSRIVSLLRDAEAMSLQQVAIASGLSMKSAEELVIRLYCMEIVGFRFVNRQFLIHALT
ncbi:MAG: ATP-binding protein [Bacteroides sp.]|nr:ATP-binding protein [Bacteroides sp.]MCM1413290.1 ATP-binding protein [Bacteroides sp.]MCM1471400.1 ATP-binding protein [Bacteroides sp.]